MSSTQQEQKVPLKKSGEFRRLLIDVCAYVKVTIPLWSSWCVANLWLCGCWVISSQQVTNELSTHSPCWGRRHGGGGGGWGPTPRRHTAHTPPPPPLLPAWTHPSPGHYKKSSPAEVVQSRQELRQVRKALWLELGLGLWIWESKKTPLSVGEFFSLPEAFCNL